MNDKRRPIPTETEFGTVQFIASGGRRCALAMTETDGWDWYVGESPRNGYGALVEGPWSHWVKLAHEILRVDAEVREGTHPFVEVDSE